MPALVSVGAQQLDCQDCGARLHVAAAQRTATCFFCRSPSVVSRPESPGRPRPAFVLGFVYDQAHALQAVHAWQQRLGFFKQSKLKRAPLEAAAGVYLPAYLYSAAAFTDYTVEIIISWTTGSGDNRRTHTESYPLQGRYASYVRDVIVTASRGVHNQELDNVEPYDLRALHRYTPGLISGWPSEDPSMHPSECMAWARSEAQRNIANELTRFLPGNGNRGLRYQTQVQHESLDLVLVPVWVIAIRPDPTKPPERIIVNGQTGRVWGNVRTDWWKVVLVVLVALSPVFLLALLVLIAMVVA